MRFYWNDFTEQDFVNYCTKMENNMLYADDYIGAVRVGDLCFDLVLRSYDESKSLILTYDLYIGGVDNGYGYGKKDNYPYDYAEGSDFEDTCISMTYKDFQKMAEASFANYIKHCEFYDSVNLIEKANEELHVW